MPLGDLQAEAQIVVSRLNKQVSQAAVMQHLAISSAVWGDDKKTGTGPSTVFFATVDALRGEGDGGGESGKRRSGHSGQGSGVIRRQRSGGLARSTGTGGAPGG